MQELLHGAGIVCIYYIVAASTILTLRRFLKVPNELFRKILHFILLGSSLSLWLDFIGSLIVAAYLIWCGVKTVCESLRGRAGA